MTPLSYTDAPSIFWDGLGLDKPGSGIHRHAMELLEALRCEGIDPVLVKISPSSRFNSLIRKFKFLSPYLGLFEADRSATRDRAGTKRAVYHGLSNINIPTHFVDQHRFATMVTVHDTIPLLSGSGVSRSYGWQYSLVFPRVMRKAERVICVSNWTKDSIVEGLSGSRGLMRGELERKIIVIPNGHPKLSDLQVYPKGGRCFLLAVARYEPYKRLDFLFDIVAALGKEFHLTLVTDARGKKTLLAGSSGTGSTLVSKHRLSVEVDLSDLELANLYRKSHLFLHTSLYEGFCLPAVEALSHRTPVIYQMGSGIDEVVCAEGGLALGQGASLSDWVAAVESFKERKFDDEFHQSLETQWAKRPTWAGAALALKALYGDLSQG